MRRLVELLPVALLAALVVVEAVANGRHLDFDGPRLAGLAVGAVAVWRRAPFLVVIVLAGLVAALLPALRSAAVASTERARGRRHVALVPRGG